MAGERSTTVAQLPGGPVEYWLSAGEGPVALVLHGGHMRAGLPLGEEVFEEAGMRVLTPSRPGYGRTPLKTGPSPAAFADVIRYLCAELGITGLQAAVGISAGGPTAVAMAARHPGLVRRLILESAVGPLPWPGRLTRLLGGAHFHPKFEKATWSAMHVLARKAPNIALRSLMRDLSLRPAREVVGALDSDDRRRALKLLSAMQSGAGFSNDLRFLAQGATDVATVSQPALVIATAEDGSVPIAHARATADAMPRARLVTTQAESHFIWFGRDYARVASQIRAFLAAPL
ncbi:alpha/beta hydrolase [Streptomyces albidoflavus]|nr:alpha/beta hydrolase [Streptomyces albidoflavus]PAX88860.1 alpha/beta hydrolase [Streptomyces albidoflavus]PBO16629.1 alpha/beta hydrolase [Streptomyces albidoflavus]PBO21177.1 alpha/beta hydrolase [Streptomyces albidoflavus]PBO30054.1 alpha/beta hydrolase [Streptomyces albidoflavus]